MPTKRVLISLDADLLQRIDRAASHAGATRSGYLRQLAEADLSSDHGPTGESAPGDLPGATSPRLPSRSARSDG
jgi:hypothetical protein